MKYSRRNFIKVASIATAGTFIPMQNILSGQSLLQVNNSTLEKVLTKKMKKTLDADIDSVSISDWMLGTSLHLDTSNIEENISILKEEGIDCVEVEMHSCKNMDVAKIVTLINNYKKAADAVGMTIWSIHIPFGWDFDISLPDPILRERSKQAILLTLKLAKGLGPYQKAILHPSFEPIDMKLRAAHIASFRTCIQEFGQLIEEEYKVRLAIECLPRTCLGNNAAEMQMLIGDIPSVDVCLDFNHLLNEKPELFATQLNNRIQTIHVSDYDGIDERHWLPGKGVVNFPAVIDALMKSGYKNPFMYEVVRDRDSDIKGFAKELVSNWKKLKKDYEAYLKNKS